MDPFLFIGRFQPFHNGHFHVVKQLLSQGKPLTIAIGSSQFQDTLENPFSFHERIGMIRAALGDGNYRFITIPDVPSDDDWINIVKRMDYSSLPSGNDFILNNFQKVTEIKKEFFVDASEIRDRILKNKDFSHLVPVKVFDYLKKIDGVERIKKSLDL